MVGMLAEIGWKYLWAFQQVIRWIRHTNTSTLVSLIAVLLDTVAWTLNKCIQSTKHSRAMRYIRSPYQNAAIRCFLCSFTIFPAIPMKLLDFRCCCCCRLGLCFYFTSGGYSVLSSFFLVPVSYANLFVFNRHIGVWHRVQTSHRKPEAKISELREIHLILHCSSRSLYLRG